MTIQEQLRYIRTTEKHLDPESDRAKELRTEAEKAIAKVQDPVLAELLTKYYIDGKPMKAVACDIGYTLRHTSRLHKKALQEISKYVR